MAEAAVDRDGVRIHSRADGPEDGASVIFANSLGTDLTLWDPLLPHLPDGLRIVRYDMRGHGRSDVPEGPYHMGTLVSDAVAVCEHWGLSGAVFVGLSVGGLVAQGLAVKRPDLVRAVVLSNTGVKIGTAKLWEDRIATVRRDGIEALADGILERWFSRPFREGPELGRWRALLVSTPADGYAGTCAAISGTDFYQTTAELRLPAIGIAGSEDGATPPDLVRETVALIPGSRTELIRGAGHLPCVEAPERYAEILTGFLRETGHLAPA